MVTPPSVRSRSNARRTERLCKPHKRPIAVYVTSTGIVVLQP